MAAAIGAEWLFVHLTGALLAGGPPAEVAAQHHQVVVVAMLLGGVVAQISGFTVNDDTARGQLVSLLIIPVPVTAALGVGMFLGAHRPAALASFAVLLGLGAWARRFGPRGANIAVLLFMGDFIGFFLRGPFSLGDLGWLAAEVGVADLTVIAVRFSLFLPNQARFRRRTQRSYLARAHAVAAVALDVFDGGTPPAPHPSVQARRVRALRRHLVRLNEAALMIDALLVTPGRDARAPVAVRAHQLLFDMELTLTNLARFAEALAGADHDAGQRAAVSRILAAVRDGDGAAATAAARELESALPGRLVARAHPDGPDTAVILRRLAGTVEEYLRASTDWLALGRQPGGASADDGGEAAADGFEPAVSLQSGWLPGPSELSSQVASGSRSAPGRHLVLHLDASTRAGIQTAVAVGASVAAGDALSPRRFYWAVLAAFISFLGVSHSLEQVGKAVYRVVGTVVGIVVGSLLVNLVGHRNGWSVLVVLSFLFLGVYLFRVNYTFMAVAITVIVAQLYEQLGEFSNSLLLLRLEETALGAVIAMLTGVVVVPVRTRRVLGAAVAEEARAISALVAAATQHLLDPGAAWSLRGAARGVDSAYQLLLTTAQPMRWSLLGEVHERVTTAVAAAGAARNYSRNLVFDCPRAGRLPPAAGAPLERASRRLRDSVEVVVEAVEQQPSCPYVRAASLFAEAGSAAGAAAQLAVRDFQLLDGALARLAQAFGARTASLDVPGEQEEAAAAGSRAW